MAKTWKLRQGQVTVIEDARTASLVIVARHLKGRQEKVAALEEVLQKLRS